MKRTLAILSLLASASALAADTDLGALALADDLADVSSRIDAASGPQRYVLSATPDYYYSGDASIPAGYYYRAVTGGGYCRYAARVPIPQGSVVLSGAADDPIIAKFGSEFPVDPRGMTATLLFGREADGQYNVADLVYSPDTSFGLTASFHCNILNPVSEITSIGFSPSSGSITFTAEGVQHTCTITATTSSSCTYADSAYNLSDGSWSSQSYTIGVAFEGTDVTAWGYATFGGGELATKGDPGIVRTLGLRTGLPGEYGSGWGYKAYNFSTDRRNWELRVPGLAVTCSGSSTVSYRNFVDYSGTRTQTVWRSYSTPLAMSTNFLFGANLLETADAYGDDGCAQAKWRVWLFPANTNRIDGCALAVIATNRADVGIIGANSSQEGVEPMTLTSVYHGTWYADYVQRQYTVNHYMSNFRITSVSGSGRTRTITFDYDVFAEARSPSENRFYYASYTASQTVTLSASLSVDTTITKPSTLIITNKNQHLFYDEGLMCTWELCVTNGIFFTRKVSNGDFRKEDE